MPADQSSYNQHNFCTAHGSLSVPYPSAKESFCLSNTHSPRGPGQQYYPWLYRNPELNPTNQWIQHVGKELVLQSCKSCCAFPKMPKRDTLIFIKHNGNRNEVWQIRPLGLGLIQPWRTGAVERGRTKWSSSKISLEDHQVRGHQSWGYWQAHGCQEIGVVAVMFFFELLFSYVSPAISFCFLS